MLLGNRPSLTVVALTLVALLGGCQTEGRHDSSGRTIQMSEEKKIETADTSLNVAAFFDRSFIVEVKRSIRDNAIPYDKYLVRDTSGTGQINTTNVGGMTRWIGGEEFWSESKFREKFSPYVSAIRDIREVRHKNSKAGFRAVGTDTKNNATCVIASAAYDMVGTPIDWGSGAYDSSLFLIFCGANPDPAKFDRLLAEVAAVEDRSAYRAALARQASAAPALPQPRSPQRTQNPLSIRWDGVADSMTGLAEAQDDGTGGTIAFALPSGGGDCQGSFLYGQNRESGRWSAACTNSLTANGTFASLGTGKGFQGSGTDSKGRAVTFTIGVAVKPPVKAAL